MWFYKSKKQQQLQALQEKSHYIKALKTWAFFSPDLLHEAAKQYPSLDLSTLSVGGNAAVEAMTDILHIAICRYRYAADLIDVEVAEVSRKRVALLRYLRTDEYLEARDYIVAHLMDLLKNIKERVGLEVCEVD